MITQPNARRTYRPHAPLPQRIVPPLYCPHHDAYCAKCMPEGLLIFGNLDIESSSRWIGAPGAAA